MKEREMHQSRNENWPSASELNSYIDIVPYQQKGDPCYGGDTGETEYENYMAAQALEMAQVHTKSGKRR